jgi:REP element-mobilizing transposase RayT
MPAPAPQLGWFHVTVAAARRGREVFASMRGARFEPTPLGRIAERQWRALCARHADALACHAFQLMPDHVHALVHVRTRPARPLPALVAAWKAAATSCARREIGLAPGAALWEDGCDIERKETPQAVATARLYVEGNPAAAREERAAKARWGAPCPLAHPRLPTAWPGAAPGEPPPVWAAFGNEALLDEERLVPLSVSRRASDAELREIEERMRALAREGAVLAISAISRGERQALDAALRAGGRAIHVECRPVDRYYKPAPLRLSALGEGRLLVISPLSSRVPLVAPLCEALNAFAREIAARSPGRG